ncbi:hypothetical protein [Sphingomonas sp. 22176]|uniref:hypothetical protein n=1 Tax=Sphingomonas sp. 22176 TaxID=3453884 RepID=UPI003F871328
MTEADPRRQRRAGERQGHLNGEGRGVDPGANRFETQRHGLQLKINAVGIAEAVGHKLPGRAGLPPRIVKLV